MTQGRDGASLAHARALKLMGVARRLSLVAAVFVIAALLAGTAGTSYAKSNKKPPSSGDPGLIDSVVVSNYGFAFDGSLEAFCGEPKYNWLSVPCLEGAGRNASPVLQVKGANTLLGASTGAALDAVSSLDQRVAVAVPLDLTDQACFGEPSAAASYPEACNEYIRSALDLPANAAVPPAPFAGTGFAEIFSQGANGNSAPENVIGTRDAAFSRGATPTTLTYLPPATGVNTPQGVAFENPNDGVWPGTDIVAIANTLSFVTGPLGEPLSTADSPACYAFGAALDESCTGVGEPYSCCTGTTAPSCTGVGTPDACCTGEKTGPTCGTGNCPDPGYNPSCTGVGAPYYCCTGKGTGTCSGFTVGTVTEFDRLTLQSGYNDQAVPFQNNPVTEANRFQIIRHKLAGYTFDEDQLCSETADNNNYYCFGPSYPQNATIGGCSTFMLGPSALTFDELGYLFVVNTAEAPTTAFVTVYYPTEIGDAYPWAVIGLPGEPIPSPTVGDLITPVSVTVYSDGISFFDDVMYVTDAGAPYTPRSKGVHAIPAVPPSVKIFSIPSSSFNGSTFWYDGKLLGEIKGPHTKLNRPAGIALSANGDTLYVVNSGANSLEMFTGVAGITGTVDLPPTLIISGPASKMNSPVGVALPQF